MKLVSWPLMFVLLSVPAFAAGERPPLGTNINGLSYWSTALPLVDVFKCSGEWVSCTESVWKDGRTLDLDERGWVRSLHPGQRATCALLAGQGTLPGLLAKRYVVDYEGRGELVYEEQARLVERSDHRDVIEILEGPGNANLSIVATDPGDYIRKIRIRRQGETDSPGELFDPLYLKILQGYRCLRFLGWILGDSPEDIAARTWSERPRPEDARWTIKGVPIEIQVALANLARSNMWICIPHAADDDYIRRFAELVRESLDPELKVYLEYSNEVWNDVFPQTAYAREQGLALGLSQDPYEATLRYYARRSAEIFSIWEKVMGRDRLVRVMCFQFDGDPAYSDEIPLSFGDTRKQVDALAIGPYFGTELGSDLESLTRIGNMDLDAFMRELEQVALPRARKQMEQHAAVARKYGLPMIAYEGGQHLWNMTGKQAPRAVALFDAANRDPRMGKIYSRYLQDWTEAGGGLFMHLLECGRYEGAGMWGALEYLTQPRDRAPKYDALLRFIEGR